MKQIVTLLAGAALALLLPPAATSAQQAAQAQAAQAFDPAQVEAGMKLYKPTAADCELCHAWSGAGRYHDTPFSPVPAGGPSLVTSTMTRAQMIEMVTCGALHYWGIMPRYRNDAWTPALRCHGKTRADIPDDEYPVIGMMQLTREQIEAVVTYVQAVYQGTGMSRDNCIKYWGAANARVCDVR